MQPWVPAEYVLMGEGKPKKAPINRKWVPQMEKKSPKRRKSPP